MIELWQPDFPALSGGLDCTPAVDTPVGIRHFCVTDAKRIKGEKPCRRFQTSVFYPAETYDLPPARLVDILEPRREEALAFLSANCEVEWKQSAYRCGMQHLTLKAQRDAPLKASPSKRPLLIYYPAGEATRVSNAAICESLAALGYIIVTLDAPRDAPVVVFPDGEIAMPPMHPDESYITPRVADVRQLLDELTSPDFADPLADAIDPSRIGMFGNSRGGYLSNICAVEDSRIRAAVNMDGFLWGFWGKGTGLNRYPDDFQNRARCLTAPILRVLAEQPSPEAARERFDVEKNDFGGPFTLIALNGFSHASFGTTPYLTRDTAGAIDAIDALQNDFLRFAALTTCETCVPILDAFFAAAFASTPSKPVAWPEFDGVRFTRIPQRKDH